MKLKTIALFLLPVFPLAHAAASKPFARAAEIAYELIGMEAASPVCQPASISFAQRKALATALANISVAGESDPAGLTPLDFAVLADDVPEIRRFVALGYSLRTRDVHGGTLLHGEALFGSMRALKFLLVHGADLNAATDSDATPLMVAVSENRADVARALLAAGASATRRTEDGNTALHYALVCRNQRLVDELTGAGAERDPRARDIAAKFGVTLQPQK